PAEITRLDDVMPDLQRAYHSRVQPRIYPKHSDSTPFSDDPPDHETASATICVRFIPMNIAHAVVYDSPPAGVSQAEASPGSHAPFLGRREFGPSQAALLTENGGSSPESAVKI